jgi:osmotically-inducible protein OsmY
MKRRTPGGAVKRTRLVMGVASVAAALAVPSTQAGPPGSDRDVRRAIEWEFVRAGSTFPRHDLDVTVVNGIVGLTGTVATIRSRSRAVRLSKTIEDVRAVVARIEVETSVRPDEDLRGDITRGLLRDAATESYEITVEVHAGVATLGGVVDSDVEKQAAVGVAEGVPGVKRVDSRIQVRRTAVRSDGDIAADVRARLARDARVDGERIEVVVENGGVTLLGDVRSARERSDAAGDAWVAGVRDVDVSNLEVRGWEPEDVREHKPDRKTDPEIRRAVADALRYDPRLEPCGVQVRVAEGRVTLSGTVGTRESSRAAEDDALNTVGVTGVQNRLRIRLEGAESPLRESHDE